MAIIKEHGLSKKEERKQIFATVDEATTIDALKEIVKRLIEGHNDQELRIVNLEDYNE